MAWIIYSELIQLILLGDFIINYLNSNDENAESLLISSDTDMENEPLNVGSSIDESHLLNCEEQHNNNKGHVTSDQETAHISEKTPNYYH